MYLSLSQRGSAPHGDSSTGTSTSRTIKKKKVQIDATDRSTSLHRVDSHDKLQKLKESSPSSNKIVAERTKNVNWLVSKGGPTSLVRDGSGKSIGINSCPEFVVITPKSAPTIRKKLDINKIHGADSKAPNSSGKESESKKRAKANWKNMLAMQQL